MASGGPPQGRHVSAPGRRGPPSVIRDRHAARWTRRWRGEPVDNLLRVVPADALMHGGDNETRETAPSANPRVFRDQPAGGRLELLRLLAGDHARGPVEQADGGRIRGHQEDDRSARRHPPAWRCGGGNVQRPPGRGSAAPASSEPPPLRTSPAASDGRSRARNYSPCPSYLSNSSAHARLNNSPRPPSRNAVRASVSPMSSTGTSSSGSTERGSAVPT